MARLSFRQGIVKDYQGGNSFLTFNGNFVSLVATTNENVQVAFVHGPKDYLFTERNTTPQAWGPFTGTDPRWLYWDINRATGVRTFGSTDKEPVESSTAPSTPSPGQMWFDTIAKEWKEWSGSSWVVVIRVFAAKLSNGSTFDSMSINATSGDFKGTQVGLTTQTRAGALIFDLSGNPILDANKRFFTTEDDFITGLPSGSRLRISNIIKTAVADESIPSFSAVSLNGVNQVRLATVADQGQKVIGLVDDSASQGDIVDFVTEGIFFNSSWDWFTAGLSVNDPIYIDNNGTITKNSQSSDQLPIGVVMDAQTIMFAPRLFPQIQGGGAGAVSMDELSDVEIPNVNNIEDTQGLSWDISTGNWKPATELKTVGGPLVGDADNATSLRMRGEQSPNEGGNKVQSYMGIFHNPGFTSNGILETRAIYGANAEMDLVLQSPNQLQLIASDSNTSNGQLWMTSRSNVVINAREEAEGIANKQLIVDRVDTGTVGVGNTSDVQLSVSSGTLQIASDVDFNNNVTIQGDLNVTGTTINAQDLTVSDNGTIVKFVEANFDVSLEDTLPTGMSFKSDGTKLYIVGAVNGSIHQYPLTTAWDISTTGAVEASFDVSLEATQPTGMSFKSDGTKLYIVDGNSDSVYQYPLTTAWDISTAGAVEANFDVSLEDGNPLDVFFKSDGTKLYMVGDASNSVYQYPLTIAWDISTTGAVEASFDASGQDIIPRGMSFKSDGTKLYIVGAFGESIHQYPLTTAWDISTTGAVEANFGVSLEESFPTGIFFKSDGTKLYVVGGDSDSVHQYPLTTAWDISTTLPTNINFNDYLDVTNNGDGTVTVDVPSTGDDANVVSGTAGGDGDIGTWNSDGDLIGTSSITQTQVLLTTVSLSANTTLPSSDGAVYLVSNGITVTLPDASLYIDRVFYIKNVDGSTITIDSVAGNIDGDPSTSLTSQYTSITVVSDGTNWFNI